MNAAYAYNNQEAAFLITNRIYYLLEQNHWSVKTLSDKSNIPYETLKKLLSHKTENTGYPFRYSVTDRPVFYKH